MRSLIILSSVLITLTMAPLSFGAEPADNPSEGVRSGWTEAYDSMKEALPPITLIIVLLINLLTSLLYSGRNFKASLIATIILVAITHWGGFYKPLFYFLTAKI